MEVITTVTYTLQWPKFLKQEFYCKKIHKNESFSFSLNCFELTSIAIIISYV